MLPGGFGVAKNHCTFAFHGPDATVRQDVADFTMAFFKAKKPVGAICISPALVALVLNKTGRHGKLTLGSGDGVMRSIEDVGQEHVEVLSPRDVVVDEELKLVTTPAYMFDDARLSDVFVGIDRCVSAVLGLL
jgi:enhancing lycopene biosynthesis protein 2